MSGRRLAERYVLRAALSEWRWAETVAASLGPEHFTSAELQGVVRALLGNDVDESGVAPGDRAEAIRADPACAGLVSELLIEETPLSDEGLEKSLHELQRARKQDRLHELQQALEAGELTADDPRREEFKALLAELGGSRRRED